jgi:hypothetical protein
MLIKGKEKNTAQVIQDLLERLSQLPQVDIRFDFEGEDTWAVITEFDEKDDSQLSIRFLGTDRWLLVAGDYDEEDDFVEIFEELTPELIQEIPEGCKILLHKVRDDEKGMRLAGHYLLRQKGQ